mgnify:CR=1 FL=1
MKKIILSLLISVFTSWSAFAATDTIPWDKAPNKLHWWICNRIDNFKESDQATLWTPVSCKHSYIVNDESSKKYPLKKGK